MGSIFNFGFGGGMTSYPHGMGDAPNNSGRILGVDPGTTSLGWALIDGQTMDLIDSGCYFVKRRRQLAGNDSLLALEMWTFWTTIVEPLKPTRVVVEANAMNRLYSNVELLVLGFATASGLEIAHVHPMTWKKLLGVPVTSNHHHNKKAAEKWVKEQGYDVTDDHQADAICIAMSTLM